MNIVEYVLRFGGDTFGKRPLNEVDSLILTELAYLNYTGIVGEEEPEKSFSDLEPEYANLIFDTLLPNSNAKLLAAVKRSERFKDVKAGYFSEYNDEQKEVRFAAVTFKIAPDKYYVAFRGTDVTVLGWKEDFNMAFSRKIPSQELAVKYLKDVAEKTEGDLIVGGHSKGGNLAVYSSVNSPKSVRGRISAIYNHDGPGFHDSIFDNAAYAELEDRIFKTLPHDSLVGILLNHTNEYKVVVSKSVLIFQHNPFAWDVKDENSFYELPSTTKNSHRNERALKEFISGMSESNREKFVEALFIVLEGSGAEKITEFKSGLFKRIKGMRSAYGSLPEDKQVMLKKNGKKLVKIWFKTMRKHKRTDKKSAKRSAYEKKSKIKIGIAKK